MKSIYLILILVLLGSCKSAFEEIRTSNDPAAILAAADNYYNTEEWLKAQTLYELAIPFYRGKKEAEGLYYNYSNTYYNMKQYTLAAYYFNSFTKTFYNSPKKEEVAFKSAYSNYLLSPSYKLDQTPSTQAIEELQTFINTYPSSPRVEECNALIDELRLKLEKKSFEEGKLYLKLANYQSAIKSLENLIKDFPETKKIEEVRYLIIDAGHELAKRSVYEKMQERLEDTIKKGEKFKIKYPDSEYKDRIESHIKYCQNELKRFI